MPYPKPDDPDYCAGSRQPVPEFDPEKQWHRCPKCGRPIAAMGNKPIFFPHVNNVKRARRGDAVQESAIHYGLNTRHPRYHAVDEDYGEAEA